MLTSLSPTLGRSVRKHAIHGGSFVESRPSSTIAIYPDLVRMQAIPSVQQPCSNPTKPPETLRKVLAKENCYLQQFCKLQNAPANYLAAFARWRAWVRISSSPLKMYR